MYARKAGAAGCIVLIPAVEADLESRRGPEVGVLPPILKWRSTSSQLCRR
jgi:hypothetical protein